MHHGRENTAGLLLLLLCAARSFEAPSNASTPDKSVEERMRELRIEMVKFQILSRLNLKEVPHSPAAPSPFSREAIRLLLRDQPPPPPPDSRPNEGQERWILHAKSDEMDCPQTNDTFCQMFLYELSLSLNTSSVDLWVYRLAKVARSISVTTSFSASSEHELQSAGWNKLQLPRIILPPSNDSLLCSVQITGERVEHRGDRRPFLLVSRSSVPASRHRRDLHCHTNESCCLKPLRVSFAEIGFNWVLYPVELEANMCEGRCSMDHSSLRTHYERAMSKVLEGDSALREKLGECWSLCCKPKQLEAVRVIYNDTDGIIHDQYIPELSVQSCSCS